MVENNEHDCRQFAEARRATLRKPYHFVDCGLPNVYLAGIRYFVCRKCGKRAAEIPAVKQLLTNIAAAVVEQEGRLTGAEIRFLRKRLGKKAAEFGGIIGVSPEQVSRWENDSNPPEKSAEKLIRLCYTLLSGDKRLRRRFGKDVRQLEGWLAALPSDEHIERIQASRGKKQEWEVEPVAL